MTQTETCDDETMDTARWAKIMADQAARRAYAKARRAWEAYRTALLAARTGEAESVRHAIAARADAARAEDDAEWAGANAYLEMLYGATI